MVKCTVPLNITTTGYYVIARMIWFLTVVTIGSFVERGLPSSEPQWYVWNSLNATCERVLGKTGRLASAGEAELIVRGLPLTERDSVYPEKVG